MYLSAFMPEFLEKSSKKSMIVKYTKQTTQIALKNKAIFFNQKRTKCWLFLTL